MVASATTVHKTYEIQIVHLIAGGTLACATLVAADDVRWLLGDAIDTPKGPIRQVRIPVTSVSYIEVREVSA